MRQVHAVFAVVLALGFAVSARAVSPGDEAPPTVPAKPTSHTERQIEGWTIRVDDRLLQGEGVLLGQKALRLLETRLYEIKRLVPEDKVTRLQKVTFWLDQTCGTLQSPQYHPDEDWLKKHEYDPLMAKCVHIPSADYFCGNRFQREQPLGVLHELAHAFHDQVLSFDHADIKAAWQKMSEGERYTSVLHASGKRRPHYAATDRMEFFAEMTESYFGANDFFPFNAAELQAEEPAIYELMERIWGPYAKN